jgi:hypothetical protein
MATLLREQRFIILRPPRTGGTWVEAALMNAGLKVEAVGLKHAHLSCGGDPFNLVRRGDHFTMSIVRDPVEWYISHWAFCMMIQKRPWKDMRGWRPFEPGAMWHPTWDIDIHCGASHFHTFIEQCIELFPGYLNHLFNLYVKVPPDEEVDVIAKTETLEDDLVNALNLAGVEFDEDLIRSTKSVNRSTSEIWDLARFSPDLLLRLIDSERRTFDRFGYPADLDSYEQYIGCVSGG